jgi:hypothetical protein
MNRRTWIILAIVVLTFAFSINGFALTDRFSLKLSPSGIFTLGGSYNDQAKLREVVDLGLGLEIGLRYEVHNNVYLDFSCRGSWLPIQERRKPPAYQDKSPAFIMTSFILNGNFYLKSGSSVEPYLSLGGSISPWHFATSGLSPDAWPAPGNPEESFSGRSLGVHVGLGVEVFHVFPFSIFGEVKYYYHFTRDPKKLGTDDFTEQDFLGINIGLIFYFKRK